MLNNFDCTVPAIHTDTVTCFQTHGRVSTAYNSRNAQLAGDDGGMRKRRAHIGHDGRGAWEDRGPANIGCDRHKDFSRLELVSIFGGMNDSHPPLCVSG